MFTFKDIPENQIGWVIAKMFLTENICVCWGGGVCGVGWWGAKWFSCQTQLQLTLNKTWIILDTQLYGESFQPYTAFLYYEFWIVGSFSAFQYNCQPLLIIILSEWNK